MKTNHWQSLTSVLLLGIFGWMAAASLGPLDFGSANPEKRTFFDPAENEYFETTTTKSFTGDSVITEKICSKDDKGRWHGSFIHKLYVYDKDNPGREKYGEYEFGFYVNGKPHGKFIRDFYEDKIKIRSIERCYNMGELVLCNPYDPKAATSALSAYSLLRDRYPWFLDAFHALGIGDDLVESYLQALESEIRAVGFQADAWNDEQQWLFDEAYDKAVDSLSKNETYKVLINYHNMITTEEALDIVRSNEFRLAVIDRHRSGSATTYETLAARYPGYTGMMFQAETEAGQFETFCGLFDEQMDMMGPLDAGDPFYLDSLDQRSFLALFTIAFSEKSFRDMYYETRELASAGGVFPFHRLSSQLRSRVQKDDGDMRAQDFGFIVFFWFMRDMQKGDMVRRAMRDLFFMDIARPPLVTTTMPDTIDSNGPILAGHVLNDGGAEVTGRGVAWDTIYNPTTASNTIASGSGTGDFMVSLTSLTGLTQGKTYYARAFATNSVGTAYGNVVEFKGVADTGTSILSIEKHPADFTVFPVPAIDYLKISLNLTQQGTAVISLLNLNGQLVGSQMVEATGRQEVIFDTGGLRPGIYVVRFEQDAHTFVRKVIIR